LEEKSRSRSLRDDNKKSKGNSKGGEAGPCGMTTRKARATANAKAKAVKQVPPLRCGMTTKKEGVSGG
jgi:hypothetical protein